MNKTIWWVIGIGAAVWYFFIRPKAAAAASASTPQPGLAGAYNAILANPSDPNAVANLVNAGSSGFSAIGNSLKNLFGGSSTAAGVQANQSTAALPANYFTAQSDANLYDSEDQIPNYDGFDGSLDF
jgi:hypothetical protein